MTSSIHTNSQVPVFVLTNHEREPVNAGLINEMHLAISPVFLGSGENLFTGIDLPKLGFTDKQVIYGEKATHIILKKSECGLFSTQKNILFVFSEKEFKILETA